MRSWLDSSGITAIRLEPAHILNGRVSFRAAFANSGDADRFIAKFDDAAPSQFGA